MKQQLWLEKEKNEEKNDPDPRQNKTKQKQNTKNPWLSRFRSWFTKEKEAGRKKQLACDNYQKRQGSQLKLSVLD